MPVGMMFAAPLGHERRLLELAFELEAARPRARIGVRFEVRHQPLPGQAHAGHRCYSATFFDKQFE